MNYLVIETVEHTVVSVKPFESVKDAIAWAKGAADENGYTDGYNEGDEQGNYAADWWAEGDPGNDICVFDVSIQEIVSQDEED